MTPNMSYCRYRNTLAAMRQILGELEDEYEEEDEECEHEVLSEDEQRAKYSLIEACQEFLDATENGY